MNSIFLKTSILNVSYTIKSLCYNIYSMLNLRIFEEKRENVFIRDLVYCIFTYILYMAQQSLDFVAQVSEGCGPWAFC